MNKTKDIEIEDIITARMRREDPDIERVGVHHDIHGWQCHRVWLAKDAPRPSAKETKAILDKANVILADLLSEHEIVRYEEATTGKPRGRSVGHSEAMFIQPRARIAASLQTRPRSALPRWALDRSGMVAQKPGWRSQ